MVSRVKQERNSIVPSHVAIIMDGNRRWARARHLPDSKGHEAGAENFEKIVETAADLGIKTLTVYALSTENLKNRTKRELWGLFNLMRTSYRTKLQKMMQRGVKVNILGQLEGLPAAIQAIIREIRQTYIKNESIELNIALNYGGQKELVEAIKDIVKKGIEVDKINEQLVAKHLYTNGQNDPDLVIRTGGSMRLSNFLLWQTAYSELYFTKDYWPDFGPAAFKKAIAWYQEQKRNFGK